MPVPERVLVGFEPEVTRSQAAAFLRQLGLEPLRWSASWERAWVEVERGSEATVTQILLRSPWATRVEQQHYPGSDRDPDKSYLFVVFAINVEREQIRSFVETIPDASLKLFLPPTPVWATVSVDAGSEDTWVAELQQHSIVASASRDWNPCPTALGPLSEAHR